MSDTDEFADLARSDAAWIKKNLTLTEEQRRLVERYLPVAERGNRVAAALILACRKKWAKDQSVPDQTNPQ